MTFEEWYEDSGHRYLNGTRHFGLDHESEPIEAALREAFEAGRKAAGEAPD